MRRPHRHTLALVALLLFATPASAGLAGGGRGQQAPASTGSPVISGTAMAGQTLSASTGSWDGVSLSYAYQWKRCDLSGGACSAVSGATASTYKLGTTDVGATLRADVAASNRNGAATATSAPSPVVAPAPAPPPPSPPPPPPAPPSNTALPQISGTLQVGQALTGTAGSWSGSPTAYAYQWKRCDTSGANCASIAGAAASSYSLVTADAASTLRLTVTATNAAGSASATSGATGAVAALPPPSSTALPQISGSAQTSQIVSSSTGSWSGSPTGYAYQWKRCDSTGGACADISAATQSSYTVASADLSKTLRVNVTATNASGSGSATSAQTGAVTAPPPSGGTGGANGFGVADGADIVFEADATRQRELDSMRAMGAKWVRFDFAWSAIEGTKGTYNWGQLDTAVKEAAARGMSVVAMLGYAPAWANGGHTDDKYGPTNPADYASYVRAVATHFGLLGVHVYEIWNEPNISVFWKPTPDVAAYSALVKAAYPAIHAADPQAVVLAGAMSPHGAYHDSNCDGVTDSGRDATGYDPIDFLAGMYSNGSGGSFDAVSHHPYERFLGTAYHACSGWSQLQQTPISIRSLMTANGDSAKKVWATEYGNAVPDWTDEAGQATRLTQAMTAWKAFAWAGPMLTFNLWDTHGSTFGLLRSDWTQRPAWFAFQTAAA